MTAAGSVSSSGPSPAPEDPVGLDDLAAGLLELRAWAGNPSYAAIAREVQQARLRRGVPPHEARVARSTVFDCMRPGRRRLDVDLLVQVVSALGAGDDGVARWRRAVRALQQPGGVATPVQVHHDLPAPSGPLVGRDTELATLLETVRTTGSVLVMGMPGVGKTALALAAADRLAGEVDLVLRVNLDGAGGRPVEADAARDALVEAALHGAPGPREADPWATYHALLASRPVLLVLDNVGSSAAVHDLVPRPGGGSRAIITSRVRHDAGGVAVLELGGLGAAASRRLFDSLAGPEIDGTGDVQVEVHEDGRLARLTGGLPLALTVLSHRARLRPEWSLQDHLDSFERARDALQLDDGLHGTLSTSYAALGRSASTLLRRAAAAPTPELDLPALGVLLDADEQVTAEAVAELGRAYLVRGAGAGRWELHDLVRVFARRASLDADPPRVVRAALDRLAGHLLAHAAAAVATAYPYAREDWGSLPVDESTFASHETAVSWLDEHRTNLLAVAAWAAESEGDAHVVGLGAVLAHHLWDRGEMEATLALHRNALAASHRLADPHDVALAHRDVAQSLYRSGRFAAARPDLEAALEGYLALGDEAGLATTRNALATVAAAAGDGEQAVTLMRAVVAHHDRTPGDERRSGMRNNLGVTYYENGQHDLARTAMQEAVDLAAEHGWPRREQWACSNLTEVLLEAGEVDRAVEVATRAFDIARTLRDEVGVGYALSNVAATHHARGETLRASELAQESLQAATDLGHHALATAVLGELASYLVALGETGRARETYQQARDLAVRIGETHGVERAEKGLADLA